MTRRGENLELETGSVSVVEGSFDQAPEMIGRSSRFQQLISMVDAVASNGCVVLVEGESGTGKELIARRIHEKSNRANGPFIPVNCPAVTETLFESQFYGHVKGSFTGAAGDTLGMVRAAEGGTLFLDEIGELPIHLQPKLLRLLQEKEITPVGGTKAVKVDVRFVAATNRSLARAVLDGAFRRDLFHRLNVVRVQVPSLRSRPDDVEPLLDFYLERYAREYNQPIKSVDKPIRDALKQYAWPGNVRELCCWVERLYAANMPPIPPQPDIWDDQHVYSKMSSPAPIQQDAPISPISPASLADAEVEAIRKALRQTNNNRSAAARMLDIHRTTLIRKMKQYSLT